MSYDISSAGVAISMAVHRALNDIVKKMTKGEVSGWQDNYKVVVSLEGFIDARPENSNKCNLYLTAQFEQKVVFLPTPEWVRDTRQKLYICFYYELADLMRKWWVDYADLIR
jgi:hypothetical protein